MRDQILVNTAWLAERLDDPSIRIVDCRFGFDRDFRLDYDESHIPGAVYLDWQTDLTDLDHPVAGMIAPPGKVVATMERLGISDETVIVAYDQEGGHFAARLWLVLARYGRGEQVKILDGGWTAWLQEGRPVTSETSRIVPSLGGFSLDPTSFQPDLVADLDDVLAATGNGVVLLDVRRWTEHTGEEVRAKRGGRIPGAAWFFWQENLDWDGDRRFLADARIAGRAAAAGLTPETPIIAYCQSGVRASHVALALKMAGYPNVQVYDGSWAEWGNRDDLPIETGERTP